MHDAGGVNDVTSDEVDGVETDDVAIGGEEIVGSGGAGGTGESGGEGIAGVTEREIGLVMG